MTVDFPASSCVVLEVLWNGSGLFFSVCVCMCVREGERERERGRGGRKE